jgi:ABC-type transport system substrate-binding protein
MLSNGLPGGTDIAQVIQADWAQLGINVTLDPLDATPYIERLLAGDFDATVSQSSNAHKFPTGLTLNSIYRIANNPVFPPDGVPFESYVTAIGEANAPLEGAEQEAAFENLHDVILDESWVLSLATNPTIFAVSPDVEGFAFSVDNMPLFQNVRVGG